MLMASIMEQPDHGMARLIHNLSWYLFITSQPIDESLALQLAYRRD